MQILDPDEDDEFANLVKEHAGDIDPDDYVHFLASRNSKRNH